MIACIDIQAAIAQRAGVGRYTKSLVEHMAPSSSADELRLFYFDFRRKGVPFPVPSAKQKAFRWCPGCLAQKAWQVMSFPPFDWFAGAADVYHFPNFVRPPLTRGRSVVTVHDVSFMRFPETTEERNLRFLTSQIRLTVERADAIITDSAFIGREIQEYLKAPADKIFPIALGLPPGLKRPSPEDVSATRRQLELDRPYLLMVSTLEPRKNIPFLIEVFEKLQDYDGELVIAGMRGWKYEPILERMRNSPRSRRIRRLDYVDEALLPGLYAGADLFLFPSLYEGFGFPPLEAMACGTPVISSAAGSLPEVLGEAAMLIPEFQSDAWAAEVRALLHDGSRREELIGRGHAQAGKFSWADTARATWDVYRKIAP